MKIFLSIFINIKIIVHEYLFKSTFLCYVNTIIFSSSFMLSVILFIDLQILIQIAFL